MGIIYIFELYNSWNLAMRNDIIICACVNVYMCMYRLIFRIACPCTGMERWESGLLLSILSWDSLSLNQS